MRRGKKRSEERVRYDGECGVGVGGNEIALRKERRKKNERKGR